MNAAMIIFKKEMRAYLRSPGFYIITALFLTVASVIFALQVNQYQVRSLGSMRQGGGMPTIHEAVIAEFVGVLHFLLFFFLPALTARLFAEEKKVRSFDLLMTSPVSSTQIVVGKLLAGIGALVFLLGVSAIYPVVLSVFAKMAWGQFFSTYLGVLLLGSAYVAIGLFCSSVTESLFVAWIMSCVMFLSLWLVALAGQNTDQAVVQTVVNHISVNYHFGNMIHGRIDTAAIAFLLTLIAFFGFLAQRAVEASRWR
jgi:ABC-2 type transport system permease protein